MNKLELGGGEHRRPGYTSIDIQPFDNDTLVHNLEHGLPYYIKDETISNIVADNVLEHIINLINLMNDCHRVMKSGGFFEIIVPLAQTTGALKDPTHVRHFVPESFDYFDEAWDYPRQPNYGIKKWEVVRLNITGEDQYRYIEVLLRKP